MVVVAVDVEAVTVAGGSRGGGSQAVPASSAVVDETDFRPKFLHPL